MCLPEHIQEIRSALVFPTYISKNLAHVRYSFRCSVHISLAKYNGTFSQVTPGLSNE